MQSHYYYAEILGFSLSYVAGFLSEVMKIRKSVYFLNLMIMKLRANTSTPLVVT